MNYLLNGIYNFYLILFFINDFAVYRTTQVLRNIINSKFLLRLSFNTFMTSQSENSFLSELPK